MSNALIGFSGFVGGNLLRQTHFDGLYRSTNINELEGCDFDVVVCAGAPAQKWVANLEPGADLKKIEGLIHYLKTLKCEKFILISTVDVFLNPIGVDESSTVDEVGLHAYGLHRRLLEKFVQNHFSNHLIVRLPGLVGPGLRKNIIFDFLHKNNLDAIESRGVFQFYPMVNLWFDIQIALNAGLSLVHLMAEPISVAEVSALGFGAQFNQIRDGTPSFYDVRSQYVEHFGAAGYYQYSKRETIQAIRAYVQAESMLKSSSVEVLV